jgi:hypothetical protein
VRRWCGAGGESDRAVGRAWAIRSGNRNVQLENTKSTKAHLDRQENVANANFPNWSHKHPRRWRAGTQTPKRGFWNGHNTYGGQKRPRSIFLPRWQSHSRVLGPGVYYVRVVTRGATAETTKVSPRQADARPHHRRPRQPLRRGIFGRRARIRGARGRGLGDRPRGCRGTERRPRR